MTTPTALSPSDELTLAWSLHLAGMTTPALALLDKMLGGERQLEALELKVLLLRRGGALADAAEAFEALARLQPEHPNAAYAACVFRGLPPPANVSRSSPWPGPFCLIERFLDDARHHELLNLVNDRAGAFESFKSQAPSTNNRRPTNLSNPKSARARPQYRD